MPTVTFLKNYCPDPEIIFSTDEDIKIPRTGDSITFDDELMNTAHSNMEVIGVVYNYARSTTNVVHLESIHVYL